MTGDEVRALCLSLPEATEKETWGDDENPGHPTFRVKRQDLRDHGRRRLRRHDQDLDGASRPRSWPSFPDAAKFAAYVGPLWLGRPRLRRDPGRGPARDHRRRLGADRPEEAGRRTGGPRDDRRRGADASRPPVPGHERDGRRAPDRGRLRPRPRRGPRRAHPVRRRRLPRRRHEPRDRPGRGRRGRRPARGRPAVLGPAGRRRHAPARIAGRAGGRRDAGALAPPDRADRRGPPGPARSCRWATPTRSSVAATARPSRGAWPAPVRPG